MPVLPYPVFALLVSSPSPVGVGGIGRLVGYIVGRCHRDLVSRPSVSFYPFRSCGPFDFPVSACGRMLCAVFVSSFSRDVLWRRVVSFSLSSRPSSRRLVSCGVSFLFFAARSSARLVFPINSPGVSSSSSFSFRSSRGGVFLSLLSSVIVGRGDGGVNVPFDDTKDAPFSSARFLIG